MPRNKTSSDRGTHDRGTLQSATDTSGKSPITANSPTSIICVTSIEISNSHATTTAEVNIKDGSSTIKKVFVPAGQTLPLYFGSDSPLMLTAGNNLTFAAQTGVTTLYFSANSYQVSEG